MRLRQEATRVKQAAQAAAQPLAEEPAAEAAATARVETDAAASSSGQ